MSIGLINRIGFINTNMTEQIFIQHRTNLHEYSSLPSTFVSSLRQLFSILDQNKSGYVPFVVFKRYFDPSSFSIDFLHELEIESINNDHFITFPLLIHVIQRAISSLKPQHFVHRSASTILLPNRFENASNPLYSTHPEIDFPMIRALKRYEIERDLLIQTSDTIEQVKLYLNDQLTDMKEQRKSYCRLLSKAETTGVSIASIYNRDLVADLLKLANTVLEQSNCDVKKLMENSSLNTQLKAKDEYIKRLEIEKRLLLKELIELRHEQGTVIPLRNL